MLQIRSALFAVYLVLSTLVIAIVLAPTILSRRGSRFAIRVWARSVIGGLKLICGTDYRVIGAENIPQTGAIIASKHQSMWETVSLLFLLPKPVIILKKELLAIPIYGWWARRAGHIGVDRTAAAKALRAMTAAAKARLEDGFQVVVFPEGTRVAPGETASYKPGVAGLYAAADAPCTPVAHNSGLYWRHPGIERRPGEIEIAFLPAIAPGLKRKPFVERLKSDIETAAADLVKTR